jgi:hypothetical protein
LIFQGLNFSRNADIGQIGHLWKALSTNTELDIRSVHGMPCLSYQQSTWAKILRRLRL